MEADEEDKENTGIRDKMKSVKAQMTSVKEKIMARLKEVIEKIMLTIVNILSSIQSKLEQFSTDVSYKVERIRGFDADFKGLVTIKGYIFPKTETIIPPAVEIFYSILDKTVDANANDVINKNPADIVKDSFEEKTGIKYEDGNFNQFKISLYGSKVPRTITYNEQECIEIYKFLRHFEGVKNVMTCLRMQIADCRTAYIRFKKYIKMDTDNAKVASIAAKAFNICKSSYINMVNIIITAEKAVLSQYLKVLQLAYRSKSDAKENKTD
ncbi:MAG TPA: hypothetical protein DCE23_06715 [Firmicutes bacterium]|nr:hypothetical protein [Bacillota bacterium]